MMTKQWQPWYTGISHMGVTNAKWILPLPMSFDQMPSEKHPLWITLGRFKNTQRTVTSNIWSFCEAATRTLQGKFRNGAAWMPYDGRPYRTWAGMVAWRWATRPRRKRTQWTPFSLSILALWWSSAPGIAAMWAWLHSTISVCSATWHWEAGIRWLHYCKWLLPPVTHTNTSTSLWFGRNINSIEIVQ